MELFSEFVAKTDRKDDSKWLPLRIHLLDTAGIISCLADKWIPEAVKKAASLDDELFDKSCYYLGLVHDIGKATSCFESMITEEIPDKREVLIKLGYDVMPILQYHYKNEAWHPVTGAAILKKMGVNKGFSQIVGAHHGQTIDKGNNLSFILEDLSTEIYGRNTNRIIWEDAWKAWNVFALKESGFYNVASLPELSVEAQMLLTGLLIIADWIASNTLYFPLIDNNETGMKIDEKKRVENAWKTLNIPASWQPQTISMNNQEFSERFGFEPNQVQKLVMDIVSDTLSPGIFILEAPMGCGKTEAALAAAEVLATNNLEGGLFFGLPTQATANGIFSRVQEWAGREAAMDENSLSIRLAHGSAELNDAYMNIFRGVSSTNEDQPDNNVVVHPWLEGRKRMLLSDFVVGTVDQILMAGRKERHVMLRHIGLAGKVVIIDECHAYDAYMDSYLTNVLTWLGAYKVPVLLLSATLPPRQRKEFIKAYLGNQSITEGKWEENISYPLVTWTEETTVMQKECKYQKESKKIQILHANDSDMINILKTGLQETGCAGIIVNTVLRVQELGKKLETVFEGTGTKILIDHSHAIATGREERDREILSLIGKHSCERERHKLIVIGSEVLEQSLDIDVDVLFTEICPMDLLLQRIGREHRHAEHNTIRPNLFKTPKCYILQNGSEVDDGTLAVYDNWIIRSTERGLPEEIEIPEDIPKLVKETYEREPIGDEEINLVRKYQDNIAGQISRADNYLLNKPGRCNKTIKGLLDNPEAVKKHGGGMVRDGDMMLDVLLLIKDMDDNIRFVPWRDHGETMSASRIPSEETIKKMLKERIRLPGSFKKSMDRVLEELKEQDNIIEEWNSSAQLSGELIWFFNERLESVLCNKKYRYSKEYGLEEVKEEK